MFVFSFCGHLLIHSGLKSSWLMLRSVREPFGLASLSAWLTWQQHLIDLNRAGDVLFRLPLAARDTGLASLRFLLN
jgi:hypothetical protein